MDNEKSNRFLFNLDWVEILRELPKEVKYEVYDAIIEYAASGIAPDLKPMALGVFLFIKREMDYNNEQRLKKIDARKEAGAKGGKAKQTKQTVANQANATFAKQTKQTVAIYDNVYVNDNVNVEDKSSLRASARDEKNNQIKAEIEERKRNRMWKESIQMHFHIDEKEVDKRLDEFCEEIICKELIIENIAMYFTNWLNRKLYSSDANRPSNTNKQSGLKGNLPRTPGHGLRED